MREVKKKGEDEVIIGPPQTHMHLIDRRNCYEPIQTGIVIPLQTSYPCYSLA